VSDFVRCPECDRRIQLSASAAAKSAIRCPFCDARVDRVDEEVRRSPRPRQSSDAKIVLGVLAGCGLLVVLGCVGLGVGVWRFLAPTSFPEQTEEYAQARQTFRTRLVRRGPAPQHWERENPPPGAREIEYTSGDLRLRAWVSGPPADKAKKPAVLFLHGGFAFGADDYEQTRPFHDAGFVVMTPTLRGENGLPGFYSMFYDEVEDVLAAAETLARLPYVDANRLYVAGHSVGGTLTMLATMTSNRFRAAASFSGSPDQVAWARGQSELVPFDPSDQREFQMRSPLAFPRSFQCPIRLYYGDQEFFFSSSTQKLAQLARKANRDVEAISVPGDHLSSVIPAMRQCISFFQQH
jgi:dienelactone hydrolase